MRAIVLLAAAAFALSATSAGALRQPNPGKGALQHLFTHFLWVARVLLTMEVQMSFERASLSTRPFATAGCNCAKTPLVYKPVCGNDFWTYGNECMAYCANVLVAHTGACGKCKIRYGSAVYAIRSSA